MSFSSFSFLWLFFPAVFLIYRIIPSKSEIRNIMLFLASLFFYSWGQNYLFLLLFCIGINYIGGFFVGLKTDGKNGDRANVLRKVFLCLFVVVDLALLGYYKYFDAILSLIDGLIVSHDYQKDVLIPPIGVSFFTFKAISYLVDVYKKKTPVQKNIISLGLYISFFAHIMSGPIVQYEEMHLQIAEREISADRTAYGIKRFIYGIGKKVLIADKLGAFVDVVFDTPVSNVPGSWYWLVMIAYTLQIYFDFSGYSDMAIGLGEMFGFSTKENFTYPYLSRSLREFWRRWHMSLNRWFQNYLYVPLGGSRKGQVRTLINLSIVFLVTGIWHGAGLTFVIWGVWHGLFMLLERTKFGDWISLPRNSIISRFYTLLVVSFGWMLFRAPNMKIALNILASMFSFSKVSASMPLALYFRADTLIALALAIVLCGPLQASVKAIGRRVCSNEIVQLQGFELLTILLISIIVAMSSTYSSFIYFKF